MDECERRGWDTIVLRARPDKIPNPPAPRFDGKNTSFESFLNAFHTYIGNREAPEEDKFQHLLLCLEGSPRKLLSGMAAAPYSIGLFRDAIQTLIKRYGAGDRLEDYLSKKIQRFAPMRRMDLDSVIELSALLDEIYYNTRSRHPFDFEQRLMAWPWLANNLRNKMPKPEQLHFLGEITKNRREENILTLRDFVRWRYDLLSRCDPYEWEDRPTRAGDLRSYPAQARPELEYGYYESYDEQDLSRPTWQPQPREVGEQVDSRPMGHYTRPPSSYEGTRVGEYRSYAEDRSYEVSSAPVPRAREGTPNNTGQPTQSNPASNPATAGDRPRRGCPCCGDAGHWLAKCEKFKLLPMKDRYAILRDRRLCYHCLGFGHGIANCPNSPDRVCGVEDCQDKHHPLVHRRKEQASFLCSIEEYMLGVDREEEAGGDWTQGCIAQQSFKVDQTGLAGRAPIVSLPLELENIAIMTVTCDIVRVRGMSSLYALTITGGSGPARVRGHAKSSL